MANATPAPILAKKCVCLRQAAVPLSSSNAVYPCISICYRFGPDTAPCYEERAPNSMRTGTFGGKRSSVARGKGNRLRAAFVSPPVNR